MQGPGKPNRSSSFRQGVAAILKVSAGSEYSNNSLISNFRITKEVQPLLGTANKVEKEREQYFAFSVPLTF